MNIFVFPFKGEPDLEIMFIQFQSPRNEKTQGS